MPKVGMVPIRRQQLVEATIEVISRHGFAETTVARIGKAAGVSTGIIHHYFGNKDDLLVATVRHMMTQLRDGVIRRLEGARTPVERVEAIIDANFAPDQLTPEVAAAWLGLWAQAPYVPGLERLQQLYAKRLRSNLRHALKGLLSAEEAEVAALGLAALIDGLWLNFVLARETDVTRARLIARDYLSRLIHPK